jgi:hypothetical protein
MENQGWCKPFIASIIIVGLTLLILWFFLWNIIDDLRKKINNLIGYATNLIGPMIDFFTNLINFVANDSKELLNKINDSIERISSSLNEITTPANALRITQLLKEKVKIGFGDENRLSQEKINVEISKVSNSSPQNQLSILKVLNTLDVSVSKNLGDRGEIVKNVRKFVSHLVMDWT